MFEDERLVNRQPFAPGARNLITDVSGLLVGNAEDLDVKTGVTVLTADQPFTAGVAVMGGAPGTRDTDLLAPDKVVQKADALILSGGSAYGLDAAGGVMQGLASAGRGHLAGGVRVPIAPAAILFDLVNGGNKAWGDTSPYGALGRAAFNAADKEFALGSVGAGTGASTATVRGGLGTASLVLPGGISVGALVAVNALGSPIVPGGRHFWAADTEIEGEFGGLGSASSSGSLASRFSTKLDRMIPGQNTTIAIVATDADLDQAQVTRMAWAAHDGMARAVQPAHTPFDGDLVFGVSTGSQALDADPRTMINIGHGGAICLSRAIARAIYEASALPGDLFPAWQDLPVD